MSRYSCFLSLSFACCYHLALVLGNPVQYDYSNPLHFDYGGISSRQTSSSSSDPTDQVSTQKFAAIGDSFSSGIGAGTRMNGEGDYLCSRYDQAFPALLWNNDLLGSATDQAFTFLACSGATTPTIISQAESLGAASQDVITITAGADDAYLSTILNECIFVWDSQSNSTYDGCSPELKKAQDMVGSGTFSSNLDKLLSTAQSKLSAEGTIYFVGYPQFFGDSDPQCNGVTWSYWSNYGKRQYLTQSIRQEMNTVISNLNNAIATAVSRAGPKVVFVNPDEYFQRLIGTFCDDGVDETDANRVGLLLYEWDTDDSVEPGTVVPLNQPLSRSGDLVMNGTFEGQINEWVTQALKTEPSLSPAHPEDATGTPLSIDQIKATSEQLATGYASSIVPDSYWRIFQLRPTGHTLIANLLIYYMGVTEAKKLGVGYPPPVQTIDACALPESHRPSSTPSATPTGTAVHTSSFPDISTATPTPTPVSTPMPTPDGGSCTMPTEPFSGNSPPECSKIDGSVENSYRINDCMARQAAETYCKAMMQHEIVLSMHHPEINPYVIPGAAENNGDLVISITFDIDSCPTNHANSTVDFSQMSEDECNYNVYGAVARYCMQETSEDDYNKEYALGGGVYAAACGLWSLIGRSAQMVTG